MTVTICLVVLQLANSGISPGNQKNIEKAIEAARYYGDKAVSSITKRSDKIKEAFSKRSVSKILKATKLLGEINNERRSTKIIV